MPERTGKGRQSRLGTRCAKNPGGFRVAGRGIHALPVLCGQRLLATLWLLLAIPLATPPATPAGYPAVGLATPGYPFGYPWLHRPCFLSAVLGCLFGYPAGYPNRRGAGITGGYACDPVRCPGASRLSEIMSDTSAHSAAAIARLTERVTSLLEPLTSEFTGTIIG